MRQSFADKLVCPFDKEELNLKVFLKDEAGDIIEGIFTCGHCKRYYPVIYGLPIMTPDEYRETKLELPIIQKWEKQLGGKLSDGFLLEEKAGVKE